MKDNNWQKEYCDKFGLCLDEECNCKKEIKFISKLLKEQRERIIEEIEELKRQHLSETSFIKHRNDFNDAYNEVLNDCINKLKQ